MFVYNQVYICERALKCFGCHTRNNKNLWNKYMSTHKTYHANKCGSSSYSLYFNLLFHTHMGARARSDTHARTHTCMLGERKQKQKNTEIKWNKQKRRREEATEREKRRETKKKKKKKGNNSNNSHSRASTYIERAPLEYQKRIYTHLHVYVHTQRRGYHSCMLCVYIHTYSALPACPCARLLARFTQSPILPFVQWCRAWIQFFPLSFSRSLSLPLPIRARAQHMYIYYTVYLSRCVYI